MAGGVGVGRGGGGGMWGGGWVWGGLEWVVLFFILFFVLFNILNFNIILIKLLFYYLSTKNIFKSFIIDFFAIFVIKSICSVVPSG